MPLTKTLTPAASWPTSWTTFGGGSTATPANFEAMSQQYVNATAWLRSQHLTFTLPATGMYADPLLWIPGAVGALPVQDSTIGAYDYDVGAHYTMPYISSATASLTISVPVCGSTGHGSLPTRMPAFALIELPAPVLGGVVITPTILATRIDPAATVGAYEVWHNMTISHTFTPAAAGVYAIVVWGEGGTNYQAGLTLGNISVTRTLA